MGRIKLKHVRKYDDGNAGPDSFTLGSATLSDESGRLMGDLALLTRPYGDIDSAVDFDEIERLANEALTLLIIRLDWMVDQLGLVESPSGDLHWMPWFEDDTGILRKPTRNEVLNLEGESRLLMDALSSNPKEDIRLLAAFGVWCIERALDAETRKHIGTIIEMYSAAGVILGHANYLLGCVTGSEHFKGAYKDELRRRGRKRWELDPKQAAKTGALVIWKERHAGKHPHLRTVEQFATEVMRRWPVLESPKVICGWSAKWTKEVKGGRTPAC